MQLEIETAVYSGLDSNSSLKKKIMESCKSLLKIIKQKYEDEVELEKVEKAAPC
jgi:hypothetical protein